MNLPKSDRGFRPSVLGTCCVPWTADGRLDESLFRDTLEQLHVRGMRDIYIFGTAGEGHAVSDGQFRQITAAFVDQMRELGSAPMVGIINLSLPTVQERISFARDLGVDRFQISLPNWGPARDAEVDHFFDEICGTFDDVHFMHYNLIRSGRIVQPAEYAQIAARHPNLVATKYGAGEPEMVAGLMAKAPMLTHFFTELGFHAGAPLGPCGLLSSVSSTNPRRAWEYFQAGQDQDWGTLTRLYVELAGLMTAVRDAIGSGRVDGAYDKVLAKISDPRMPLQLLPPQEGSDVGAYEEYRKALEHSFPQWLPTDHPAPPVELTDPS
jgi:dihydrodipicolinate synthase/N-acetylneuraminate lyase